MKRKYLIIVSAIFICLILGGISYKSIVKSFEIRKQLNLGEKYLQEQKYKEAILTFEKVIKIDAKNTDARAGMVKTYIKLLKPEEADKIAKEAININPNNSKTYLKLSKVYEDTNKISDEILTLEDGLKKTNNRKIKDSLEELRKKGELPKNSDADQYYVEGLRFVKENKENESINSFTKVIGMDSSFCKAYIARGNSYNCIKKYDEAIKDFTKAIELNSNSFYAYLGRGDSYCRIEKNDEALKDYTKAIEINPNSDEGYIARGEFYRWENKYDEAIKDFTKAIELKTGNYHIYTERANCYYSLQQYDKAITDTRKDIEVNIDCNNAYSQRAQAYVKLKMYSKALEDFNKAIEIINTKKEDNIWKSSLYIERGDCYKSMEKNDLAVKDYEQALALDPASQDYINSLIQELSH